MKPYELTVIEDFYKDKVALRSNVPLINHIHEGIAILSAIRADDLTIRAFCLHPIAQANCISAKVAAKAPEASELANLYARIANSYLCRPKNDHITNTLELYIHLQASFLPEEWQAIKVNHRVWQMLYADKVQNQKDFLLYQDGHLRYAQLANYFNLWLDYLRWQHNLG